jgi:hypothetical protein
MSVSGKLLLSLQLLLWRVLVLLRRCQLWLLAGSAAAQLHTRQ